MGEEDRDRPQHRVEIGTVDVVVGAATAVDGPYGRLCMDAEIKTTILDNNAQVAVVVVPMAIPAAAPAAKEPTSRWLVGVLVLLLAAFAGPASALIISRATIKAAEIQSQHNEAKRVPKKGMHHHQEPEPRTPRATPDRGRARGSPLGDSNDPSDRRGHNNG
jgi:hypothetical protein